MKLLSLSFLCSYYQVLFFSSTVLLQLLKQISELLQATIFICGYVIVFLTGTEARYLTPPSFLFIILIGLFVFFC